MDEIIQIAVKRQGGFEKKVLEQYKQGKSYVDIANTLETKVKSVDTAIQRIRRKATKIKESIN